MEPNIKIPPHLLETFDDFVCLALSALNNFGTYDGEQDWTDEEKELVKWLEQEKYK